MAKGQQRSNKEAKKPKQDKPKKSATANSSVTDTFHGKAGSKTKGSAKK